MKVERHYSVQPINMATDTMGYEEARKEFDRLILEQPKNQDKSEAQIEVYLPARTCEEVVQIVHPLFELETCLLWNQAHPSYSKIPR